jgi:hypothetical protein
VLVTLSPVSKIMASNLAEAIGFFRAKNPQHTFLRRGSKAVGLMSQILMLKNPSFGVELTK